MFHAVETKWRHVFSCDFNFCFGALPRAQLSSFTRFHPRQVSPPMLAPITLAAPAASASARLACMDYSSVGRLTAELAAAAAEIRAAACAKGLDPPQMPAPEAERLLDRTIPAPASHALSTPPEQPPAQPETAPAVAPPATPASDASMTATSSTATPQAPVNVVVVTGATGFLGPLILDELRSRFAPCGPSRMAWVRGREGRAGEGLGEEERQRARGGQRSAGSTGAGAYARTPVCGGCSRWSMAARQVALRCLCFVRKGEERGGGGAKDGDRHITRRFTQLSPSACLVSRLVRHCAELICLVRQPNATAALERLRCALRLARLPVDPPYWWLTADPQWYVARGARRVRGRNKERKAEPLSAASCRAWGRTGHVVRALPPLPPFVCGIFQP